MPRPGSSRFSLTMPGAGLRIGTGAPELGLSHDRSLELYDVPVSISNLETYPTPTVARHEGHVGGIQR